MGRGSAGQVLETEGVKAWHKRREVLQWGIPGRRRDLCWQQGAEQAHTAANAAAAVAQAWASAHRPGRVGQLEPAPRTEGTPPLLVLASTRRSRVATGHAVAP